MNKRNLALLSLIVVCALAVGLLVYYLIFYNFNKSNDSQNVEPVVKIPTATLITNTPQTKETSTNTPNQIQPSTTDEIVQQDAGQVAKIFVQRFGTYSNQEGAEQFSDLKLFITAKMQTWVDNQIDKILGSQTDYKIPHSVRTQVVSVKILSLDKASGTATVMVGARRTDQTGDAAPKISNPEIKVEMVKAGKRWQVDSIVWQ